MAGVGRELSTLLLEKMRPLDLNLEGPEEEIRSVFALDTEDAGAALRFLGPSGKI